MIDPKTLYTKCSRCAHFVDKNDSEPFFENGVNIIARFVHLDDDEVPEYDHNATPGQTMSLAKWRKERPELFRTYADGKIGPNSIHGPKR